MQSWRCSIKKDVDGILCGPWPRLNEIIAVQGCLRNRQLLSYSSKLHGDCLWYINFSCEHDGISIQSPRNSEDIFCRGCSMSHAGRTAVQSRLPRPAVSSSASPRVSAYPRTEAPVVLRLLDARTTHIQPHESRFDLHVAGTLIHWSILRQEATSALHSCILLRLRC